MEGTVHHGGGTTGKSIRQLAHIFVDQEAQAAWTEGGVGL